MLSIHFCKCCSWPPSLEAGLKRDIKQTKMYKHSRSHLPPQMLLCVLNLWSLALEVHKATHLRGHQAQIKGKLVAELAQGAQ